MCSTHVDFEFLALKFHRSSRMAKRWLAFVLKRRSDVLCCLYTLPSIVLSRKHEQYGKAYEILTGRPLTKDQQGNAEAST